jgi:hypothetical protein
VDEIAALVQQLLPESLQARSEGGGAFGPLALELPELGGAGETPEHLHLPRGQRTVPLRAGRGQREDGHGAKTVPASSGGDALRALVSIGGQAVGAEGTILDVAGDGRIVQRGFRQGGDLVVGEVAARV